MNASEQSIRLVHSDGSLARQMALEWQRYRGEVAGPLARFTLEQQFSNRGEEPLELLYTFPLNSNMVITGFRLLINGQQVDGEVRTLEEAQASFDQAVLAGNTASFLQQHRSNVFTLNVGNLAPGDRFRVQIRLVQWLHLRGGVLRLLLPTVVGPRYIPGRPTGGGSGFGWANPTDQVPDAEWITPPVARDGVPYRTSFELVFDAALPVRRVESPSHRIRVERKDGQTMVTSATNSRTNRDVVVTVELENLPRAQAWSAPLEDSHLVTFWLQSDTGTEEAGSPRDVVFLIDVSGSMAYQKLEVVKQAVRLCLRKLSSRDRFQLIVFSSGFETWREGWQAMDDASLASAEAWLEGQEAAGGTELLPALHVALDLPTDPERESLLVLLTDGQVGNEQEVAAAFREKARDRRVLLFGIDTAVNQDLFESITRVCPGTVEYIYPGEALEHRVNLQFERAGLPLIKKFELVEKDHRLLRRFPEEAFSLHSQDCQPCLLLIDGPPPESLTVLVTDSLHRQQSVGLQVHALDKENASALVKLYADQLIRHYQKRYEAARMQHNERHANRLKKEIVAIGLSHQLQTRFTAWFAEFDRREKVDALPRIQVIPVELPESWVPEVLFDRSLRLPEEISPLRMPCVDAELLRPEKPLFKMRESAVYSKPSTQPSFVVETLLSQGADGRIVPKALQDLTPTTATLLSLIGLLAMARQLNLELDAYRSNIRQAIGFAVQQPDFGQARNQQLAACVSSLLEQVGLPDARLGAVTLKTTQRRRILARLKALPVTGKDAFWNQLRAVLEGCGIPVA